MAFIPLVRAQPLPSPGTAIEQAVMDWKAKAALSPFERAKDVAAFANHYGGTLLIGASEKSGVLGDYVWRAGRRGGPDLPTVFRRCIRAL